MSLKEKIQVQELRIGNWVYRTDKGTSFQITLDHFCEIQDGFLSLNHIEPMMLNEGWMPDWGFKPNHDNSNFLEKGDITVMEKSTGYIVWHKGHALGQIVKHVHKFQNLYYELTGQECNL
jgi:hypothetical protein